MVQAGAECWNHPAPCLRRNRLSIHNGLGRTWQVTLYPLDALIARKGGEMFCVCPWCGAVYGLFAVHGAAFCCLAEQSGGGARAFSWHRGPVCPAAGTNKNKEDT